MRRFAFAVVLCTLVATSSNTGELFIDGTITDTGRN